MHKIKNQKRKLYEKFYLNIYFIVPCIVLILYLLIYIFTGYRLSDSQSFNSSKIEISITIAGILLTIMGLFTSLPNTEFRQLMKKYNHDKIINRTLFFGVIASIFTVILSVIEKLIAFQSILFVIALTETIVASIWLYKTLININD